MSDESVVPHALDDYFSTTAFGSIQKAISNNFFGINHRQISGSVPMNKDSYGLTFFVRPQINLQSDNVRNIRQLYPLLSNMETSIQRFVRCTLDPRLQDGYGSLNTQQQGISCPFLDSLNAFIPILTNNLNSISGWPDLVTPIFTSKPGLYQEEHSFVDGVVRNYSAFDINATFRNTKGDPIVYLFYIWLHYQALVFEGLIVPYPDFIVENEIDYNTRIYRLVLDPEKRYVRKIAACGVAFPLSVPMGEFFDFSNEKPFNDQVKDITIRFRCMGAIYQDDILIKEFNSTVVIFNPSMEDGFRESVMIKVHPTLLHFFNNRGYPRINPSTYELEWWVSRDIYLARTATLEKVQKITVNTNSILESE